MVGALPTGEAVRLTVDRKQYIVVNVDIDGSVLVFRRQMESRQQFEDGFVHKSAQLLRKDQINQWIHSGVGVQQKCGKDGEPRSEIGSHFVALDEVLGQFADVKGRAEQGKRQHYGDQQLDHFLAALHDQIDRRLAQ